MAAYTTIDDSEAYFQTVLYTGSGSGRDLTFGGDTDMQPDIVWLKRRNGASNHFLYDSARGAPNEHYPNLTNDDSAQTTGLTAFNSDGFTLGDSGDINASGQTLLAWGWKKSATSGIDIVDYDGTGSATTFAHSLSAVPHMIITKVYERDGENWAVYHHRNTSSPETDYLELNDTAATADDSTYWNDEAPTSSVFSVGTVDETNASAQDIVAYVFTSIQGFSKFGTFEGNADADGTFIYTGFRPAFVMLKNIDTAEDWMTYDNKRLGYNQVNNYVAANTTVAEGSGDNEIDLLSNGFKLRTSNTGSNRADTHIYMAFAEAPFVNSNGVPCNAR